MIGQHSVFVKRLVLDPRWPGAVVICVMSTSPVHCTHRVPIIENYLVMNLEFPYSSFTFLKSKPLKSSVTCK